MKFASLDIEVPGHEVTDDDLDAFELEADADEEADFQEELERIESAERDAAADADLVRLC